MMDWDQAKCRILFTFHQLNSWNKYKNDCFCFLIYHDHCVVPRSSGVTRFNFFVNIVHDQSPHQFPGAQGVLSKVMNVDMLERLETWCVRLFTSAC